MIFRKIRKKDLADLFAVRVVTRENRLSLEQLAGLGITSESVAELLESTYRGWLCADDGKIVGFAIGNRENGEMQVIAVLPDYENRGIGAELLSRVEDWLWSAGWKQIWLTTDLNPALRAYGFYRRQGWVDHKIEDELRYMQKVNPSKILPAD